MDWPLKHGKLVPPRSIKQALKDRRKAVEEIARIEQQLADTTRVGRYDNIEGYRNWRKKAEHALRMYRLVENQLAEWLLLKEADGMALLKRAHKVLKDLQEDDVEFRPDELELIRMLDAFTNEIKPEK